MIRYKLVVGMLDDTPDKAVTVMQDMSLDSANKTAKLFCGKGWTMHRRDNLHTFGDRVYAKIISSKDKED
jgi:hypothetical protein